MLCPQIENLQHELRQQQESLLSQQAMASMQQEQGRAGDAADEARLCAAEEGIADLQQDVEQVFKPALRALGTSVEELAAQVCAFIRS